MKILLISNMYPSNSHPSLGVFVKNIEDILLLNHHEVDKIVIDRKYSSKLSKILSYLLFYFRVFWGLMFKNMISSMLTISLMLRYRLWFLIEFVK